MRTDAGSAVPRSGDVRYDDQSRAAAADDFGHVVHHTPRVVLRPRSDEDVVAAVREAGPLRARVAAQGSRHSVWGRSQVADGVVIDMSALTAVDGVGTDRVTVAAGATWSDVLAATLPLGLTPPVLPEYLGLSVGGTLAVGGVGGTTSTFGAVSDTVVELDVVTGRAERVTCSANRNADLFAMVRAGLGQVAVITRATLRLVPAPQELRSFRMFYPDLAGLVRDARRLTTEDRFDVVKGAITATPAGGWTFELDVAATVGEQPADDDELVANLDDDPARRQRSTVAYLDHLRRLDALEAALRVNGQWFLPHPWLTTFVGDATVESVVGAELDRLIPATDLGPLGQVVLSPIRTRAIRSPLLRLPSDGLCWAFNLIRIPTTDDRARTERLVGANRAVYDRIRAAGGTLYPASAFPMSVDDWRHHFGPAFGLLQAAKQRFDPDLVLTPGYEIFASPAGSRPGAG
jgi:FAD/FMN-containing dehydrogenase